MNASRLFKIKSLFVLLLVVRLSCDFPTAGGQESTESPIPAETEAPVAAVETEAPISPCAAFTVAYWDFDQMEGETLVDVREGGNDGAIHGATCVEVDGRMGLQFDGVDDYVEISNLEAFNLDTFTIEIILRIDNYPGGEEWLLFKGYFYGNYSIYFFEGSNGVLTFVNQIPASTNFSIGFGGPLPLNEFVHIVVSRSPEVIKTYVNGVPTGNFNAPSDVAPWEDPVIIGAGGYEEIEEYFNGMIGAVRISSAALDPADFLETP